MKRHRQFERIKDNGFIANIVFARAELRISRTLNQQHKLAHGASMTILDNIFVPLHFIQDKHMLFEVRWRIEIRQLESINIGNVRD